MKETLQEKIKEVLPKEKEINPFTKSLQEEITLSNNRIFNQALSDVHSSLPKVMEVVLSEVKKIIEEKKECDFEPDGEYHSCYNGCNGTVQNCKKCHRDICDNKLCPNGKADNGCKKYVNKKLDDLLQALSLTNKEDEKSC